jgi:rod shape-determining protein MreC
MNKFSRWWSKSQSSVLLVLLILGAAGLVKITQGSGLLDLNRWLAWPFKPDGAVQQQVLDAQTKGLQQRIQELEAQNRSLKALLDLPVLPGRKQLFAAVLSRSADNWWQQLTLGKGSADGVTVDSVVIAPGGLVGRVMTVTLHTSRVLLLSDPNSQIGITVTRSRQVGILKGQSDQYGVLEFFEKTPDVKMNDAIVTSTLSSRFPPGLPIGRISELRLEKQPIAQAIVEFAVPIDHLECVSILVDG